MKRNESKNSARWLAAVGGVVTAFWLMQACYLPGAKEAIEAQRVAAASAEPSGGAKPKLRKSTKKSPGSSSKAETGGDSGELYEPGPLNDAMKPAQWKSELAKVYMPDNAGGSPGETFYVAEDGDDSNPGTEAAPWATLQKAADTLEPGQTVLVKDGVYDETDLGPENWYHTDIHKSGRPGQYITYKNYPGHRPTIFVRSWNGFQVNGASYIHIEGFEVRGIDDPEEVDTKNPEHFGGGISVVSTADKEAGKKTSTHHIRIVNNVVHHVGGNGISGAVTDKVLIAHNQIYHVSHRSTAGNSAMSMIDPRRADSGDTSGKYSFVFAGNVCYDNENQFKFFAANMITDGNCVIIDYFKETPGFKESNQRTLIVNNIAFNNGGRAFHVYKAGKVDIVNNTAYKNLRSESLQKVEGELSAVDSFDVNFVGNVAVTRPGVKAFGDGNSQDLSYSHNRVVTDVTFALNAKKKKHPTDKWSEDPDWLGFQNATIDEGEADFRLAPGSPAVGVVTHELAPSVDYFASRRPLEAKDAGALQSNF